MPRGTPPTRRVMAQVAMVMNLDKCIGCHTCSVTCKQTWTNRSGTEYVWFNNGYEDQEHWKGGWRLKGGRLVPRSGGRARRLARLFANPELPALSDYYEPWTYDYANLTTAPLGDDLPTAPPRSLIDGRPTDITWGPNWDDDLGGGPDHLAADPVLKKMNEKVRLEYEQPKNAPSATPASKQASPPSAQKPASDGCATSASSSTTPTKSAKPQPHPTKRTSTRPSSPASSTPTTPPSHAPPRNPASPTTGSPPPAAPPSAHSSRTTAWHCRCIRNTAPCRWSGTCRRCRRWSSR